MFGIGKLGGNKNKDDFSFPATFCTSCLHKKHFHLPGCPFRIATIRHRSICFCDCESGFAIAHNWRLPWKERYLYHSVRVAANGTGISMGWRSQARNINRWIGLRTSVKSSITKSTLKLYLEWASLYTHQDWNNNYRICCSNPRIMAIVSQNGNGLQT